MDEETFAADYATVAIALDLMYGGGNFLNRKNTGRAIVDSWCSGRKLPHIEEPDLVAEFSERGCEITEPEKVERFCASNDLDTRLARLEDFFAIHITNTWRKKYVQNSLGVFEAQLQLRRSMVGLAARPDDVALYERALGRPPQALDTTELKDTLLSRLSAVGISRGPLSDRVAAWRERCTMLDADAMFAQWEPTQSFLVAETRDRILPYLPQWVAAIPPSVDFSIERSPVRYSGVNLAFHGFQGANPTYSTVLKLSSTPRTLPEYEIMAAHEGRPGHDLHISIVHTLFARGEYGFETTLLTLCSPFAALAEAIATSTFDLLYGDDLTKNRTPDQLVALAIDDMNFAGRTNVVVRYVEGDHDRERLQDFLYEEHGFTKENAVKYTGWLFDPTLGPLAGVMYLPSYGVGRAVMREAIQEHGREKVIPIAYGTRGQIDLITFPEALKQR